MKHFPSLWLSRLNETVTSVRRRQGWMDIQAAVEPPQQRGQPPLLRLEKAGAFVVTPLDLRAVELMMRTGQQGPLLIEIKQAFLRLLKSARRREGCALYPRASGALPLITRAPMEQFTRREVLRIVDLPEKKLAYWERLHLVRPRRRWGKTFYRFCDLISLRTIKQLTEQRVPARRLRRSVDALERQLAEVQAPLTQLRILSNGRNIVVEHAGARLEPLSGQLLLNFETQELHKKVQFMPERTAEEWFALALDYERDPATHPQAIDAYRRVLEKHPHWVEPHLNLGTLLFEQGEIPSAANCYRRAVALDPQNPLAHFNLACVLDELGQFAAARQHLQQALHLKPNYSDAHYNLAFLCDKLGDHRAARPHWRRYLELDPDSPWAKYARQRLVFPRPPKPS